MITRTQADIDVMSKTRKIRDKISYLESPCNIAVSHLFSIYFLSCYKNQSVKFLEKLIFQRDDYFSLVYHRNVDSGTNLKQFKNIQSIRMTFFLRCILHKTDVISHSIATYQSTTNKASSHLFTFR